MSDYLLTLGDSLATRNGGLVIGQCPECCGGSGGPCCGTLIPGTSITHKCSWPMGGPIQISATLTGSYFYEEVDVVGASGQPPIVRNQAINMSLVYSAPPATVPANVCAFQTQTVTNGTIGNSDRKEMSVRWGQDLSLVPTDAFTFQYARNYGNVPGTVPTPPPSTLVRGVHILNIDFPAAGVLFQVAPGRQDNVFASSPAWAAVIRCPQPIGGTFTYTHSTPVVVPGFASSGCLVGVSGSASSGWQRFATGLGFTRRTTVAIAVNFSVDCPVPGCGGGADSPDTSEAIDAMMRGQFGRPCQGCG